MEEEAKQFFEQFVSRYDLTKNMEEVESYYYKYHHTYRVVEMMKQLLKKLNWKKDFQELAITVAYFHDLGRFRQLEKKKHYDDLKTNFDHAKESVNILEEYHWLEQEKIGEETKEIIKFAIYNHNKYQIEDTNRKKGKELAELLRDADKLVILKEFVFDKPSSTWKEKVLKDFQKMQLLDCKDIESSIEEALFYLAFLFDLNYLESIEIVEESNLLKPYQEYLQKNLDQNTYEIIQNTIQKYIQKRKGD